MSDFVACEIVLYIVIVELYRIVELQNKLDAMMVESQQTSAGRAITRYYTNQIDTFYFKHPQMSLQQNSNGIAELS